MAALLPQRLRGQTRKTSGRQTLRRTPHLPPLHLPPAWGWGRGCGELGRGRRTWEKHTPQTPGRSEERKWTLAKGGSSRQKSPVSRPADKLGRYSCKSGCGVQGTVTAPRSILYSSGKRGGERGRGKNRVSYLGGHCDYEAVQPSVTTLAKLAE